MSGQSCLYTYTYTYTQRKLRFYDVFIDFSKILQLYTYTYTYTQRKCRIYDAFIDFRQKSGFIHIHIHIHIKTYVSFWIILLPISGRMHTEFSPKMPCCKLILNGYIFRIRAVGQRFDFFGGAA